MTAWPVTGYSRAGDDADPGFDRRPRASAPEVVILRNGATAVVRQVQPTDVPLLVDGFDRLSVQSRQRRFLTGKHRLTEADLRSLTNLDHYDREALGMVDAATGQGIGIVRYVRSVADPQAAELAVAVVDAWHRQGVASALLSRLARRARAAGIYTFTALVSADNDAATGLLRAARAPVELTYLDAEVAEYEITLTGAFLTEDRSRMPAAVGE